MTAQQYRLNPILAKYKHSAYFGTPEVCEPRWRTSESSIIVPGLG